MDSAQSASQVRGAATEGGSAAGAAPDSQGEGGKRGRGKRGALKSPPSSASASLAGWQVTESFSGHSMSWLWLAWPRDALS